MTDIVQAPPIGRSMADIDSAKRVRRRYSAERRFQAYGIGAIVLAAAFIVVLLGDVVQKSIPAFTQTRAVLDVAVSADTIDPQGDRKPETLASADYMAPIREALRKEFPAATSRADRRALSGLLSSGADADLRSQILSNPGLIGQTVRIAALLSDDADLFAKGRITDVLSETGRGSAVPSGTEGEISIATTGDDFAAALRVSKEALARQARYLLGEANRVEANARDASGEERQTLDGKVADLRSQAAEFQRRADDGLNPEILDGSLPSTIVHLNGGAVKATEISAKSVKGTVLLPLTSTSEAAAGSWRIATIMEPEAGRRVSDVEAVWLGSLAERGLLQSDFNWPFFARGDSREPELAGVLGGVMGSLLTMAVTLALSLPIGVLAAIYLEEFAPKNRLTELIEVNINNLAAVPSIVFGLLGLAVFLNFFGMPRSAPIVGGIVIALMVLPTIIIASRSAIRAVPPSIREAALGVGASHQQAVFHHVLPLAVPGILTGTIIGMAHALGETAPLIMIGMVAFVVDVPTSFTEAASVLPVQIFSWADLPEIAFQAKTAAAILVLLVFLFVMNAAAIVLRKRFERRW